MGVFSALDSDELQLYILSVLEKAPISDSRNLPPPQAEAIPLTGDHEASQAEDQLLIKGALDSLVGKEVSLPSIEGHRVLSDALR